MGLLERFRFGQRTPEVPLVLPRDPRPERPTPVVRKTGRGTSEISPEATQMAQQMIGEIYQKKRADRPAHLWPEIAETKALLDRAVEDSSSDAETHVEKQTAGVAGAAEAELTTPAVSIDHALPTVEEHLVGADAKPLSDKEVEFSRDQFSHLSPELADKMRNYEKNRVKEAPRLEQKDFLNARGELIDFSQAQNINELIAMLQHEGSVRSDFIDETGKPQEVSADLIINQIYKLIYQDLNSFDKSDWTAITLRHNLRSTVWKVIQKYQQSEEFRDLRGLDLYAAQSIPEVIKLIGQWGRPIIATNGQSLRAQDIYACIEQGRLDLLPGPIRHKVIGINLRANNRPEESVPNDKPGLVRRTLGKLKFWGK